MQLNQSMKYSSKAPSNIPWFATILIAIAIFIVSQMIGGFIMVFAFMAMDLDITSEVLMTGPLGIVFSLLIFPFLLIACLLVNKFIYRHPVQALGFFKENLPIKYLTGVVLGIGMIAVVYIINVLTGAMHGAINPNISWFTLIWIIGLFMIQGLTEEVLARGFLMNKVSNQLGVLAGIIINSLFFALLHFLNPNTNILCFINLFLAGLVFSLLFYWSDNIWLTGAAHSFWNITLGAIVGDEVSGQVLPVTIINSTPNKSLEFINGGQFGLEGGIVVTVVALCVIVVLVKMCLDKYK